MTEREPTRFEDFDPSDWRRRPRRDAAGVRRERLSVRVTLNEYNAICELARNAGMTMADYVVCRCLSKHKRIHPDNDLRV